MPSSDAELVVQACRGDTEAFALLVERHQDYVYNAAVHMVGSADLAEDIAQEVFLKAFRGLRSFRHHDQLRAQPLAQAPASARHVESGQHQECRRSGARPGLAR